MNARTKKVTIREVALRAGVSPSTVSLVLNGKGAIPQETRARVLDAVKELRYSFNYTARAMVTKKTNIVGVVIPDISNAFFAETVRHMQVALAEKGYDIILCNSEEKAENDIRYVNVLAGRNVDGLILTPSAEAFTVEYRERVLSVLEDLNVPYLFFDRYFRDSDRPRVAVDNAESSYRVARYLVENGHKKIGTIAGPLILNSSEGRICGLRRAMEEAGLSLSDEYIYEGKYDFETGVKGAEKLIEKGVSAIFAFSDMQAYGVYECAAKRGMKIPDDLSVTGFDDNLYSFMLDAPLTTMRQPVKKIAESACDMILQLIHGNGNPENVSLPAEFIVRKSVKKM